jgi:hypothetical protein
MHGKTLRNWQWAIGNGECMRFNSPLPVHHCPFLFLLLLACALTSACRGERHDHAAPISAAGRANETSTKTQMSQVPDSERNSELSGGDPSPIGARSAAAVQPEARADDALGGAAAVNLLQGPFELRDALTFYIVNQAGADFVVHLKWRDPYQAKFDRPLLVRVFDPDEHLLLRHDEPGERAADVSGDAPPHLITLAVRMRANAPPTAKRSGVYQVALNAFGGALEFSTEPKLPFGIFGYPQLAGRTNQFASTFICLPPRLDTLQVRGSGLIDQLTLTDESGSARLSLRGQDVSSQIALPNDASEHIWRLSVQAPGDYTLNFAGLPIMLCPDRETAQAIRASVDVLDDGTICFHKFQVRAHELLARYRSMPPSSFSVRLPILVRDKSAWLADAARNQLLLGPYGVYSALPAVLDEQNLDPRSPWFGTIHVWRQPEFRSRLGAISQGQTADRRQPIADSQDTNPWSFYTRLGLSRAATHVTTLGAVYSIDEPFNPLYHDEALRNRIIIASLQELMLLREHELPFSEFTSYAGGHRAFTFAAFTQTYPWVIHDCPADVRQVWTDGLRRYVDHETVTAVSDPMNQWTFIIKGLQHFADGSGESWYRDIVRRHVDWILNRRQWNNGFQPAGYFNENEGPDATYNGITLHNLGWVYKQTNYRPLLDALRACMNLFNHTVAPDPDGSWLGASSFCHRTPGDWTAPQFGAGFGMLADEAPEAAVESRAIVEVRHQKSDAGGPGGGPVQSHRGGLARAWSNAAPTRAPQQVQAAQMKLLEQLRYMDSSAFTSQTIGPQVLSDAAEISFAVWEHFASAAQSSRLPVEADDRFTRNFGDEFFCVRRPRYYAFLYAGHTMGQWLQAHRPQDAHAQHPRNAGGLCMFWSPAMGTSLLSKNWSAYAAHCLIAESGGARGGRAKAGMDQRGGVGATGVADWEDYWSIRNSFDEARSGAQITGTIRNQPIEFIKRYSFLEDRVNCELTLQASKAVSFNAFDECFPYSLEKPQRLEVTLLDERGEPVADGQAASAIKFSAAGCNESHLIVFAQPRVCSDGVEQVTDVYRNVRTHGRVLAALPSSFSANQVVHLRWSVMQCFAPPTNAEHIRRCIREVRNASP